VDGEQSLLDQLVEMKSSQLPGDPYPAGRFLASDGVILLTDE
jgi:hypothetical protein